MATLKDSMVAAGLKAGLAGGRKFGSDEHKLAIRHILESEMDVADKASISAAIEAVASIGNLSQLCQRLEKADIIDRAKKVGNDEVLKLLLG